jgi:hypothetical protein
VFENKELREVSGLKKDEVSNKKSLMHTGELHDLYGPSNIIRIVNSRVMMG